MNTGQPLSKITKDTDRDYTMTAKAAEAYGLIDQVLYPATVKATEEGFHVL